MTHHAWTHRGRNSRFILTTGLLALVIAMTGCASSAHQQTHKQKASLKRHRLEIALRKARWEIDSLKERNSVLESKIKRAQAAAKVEAEEQGTDIGSLEAFKPGVGFDTGAGQVMSSTRQPAALLPQKLPQKPAGLQARDAEAADRVLARAALVQMRRRDPAEAERSLGLLAKSYPESPLIAETQFQLGLYWYRHRNTERSDYFFSKLTDGQQGERPAPRAQLVAGSLLMRGLLAANHGATRSVAKSYLLAVIKKYPGTVEARRASRELKTMAMRVQ